MAAPRTAPDAIIELKESPDLNARLLDIADNLIDLLERALDIIEYGQAGGVYEPEEEEMAQ